MQLLLVLLSQPNQFSNYTSYYELFAGLSSALAGIQTLRSYIVDRLTHVFEDMKKQIESANDMCSAYLSQLLQILSGSPLDDEGKAHLAKVISSQQWLKKIEKDVNPEEENRIVNQLAVSVFMYVFYSCVFFLAVAGFQQDRVLTDDVTYRLVANYELLSAPAFISLLLCISCSQFISGMPVRTGTVAFTLVVIIASLLTWKVSLMPIVPSLWLIVGSLILAICPIVILFFRGILYLPYWKLRRIQSKLSKIGTDNDEAGKWLLNQAMGSFQIDKS